MIIGFVRVIQAIESGLAIKCELGISQALCAYESCGCVLAVWLYFHHCVRFVRYIEVFYSEKLSRDTVSGGVCLSSEIGVAKEIS